MKHKLLYHAAIGILIGVTGQISQSATIPYPNVGTPNPVTYTFTAATSADVVAYFAGSSAAYDEKIGLLDNGVLTSAGYGLDDHSSSLGQTFDFGQVKAGDQLVFVLNVVSPALGLVYSDPSLNGTYDTNGSDGHNHVYSVPYTAGSLLAAGIPSGTYVAFEDLPFPGSDFNYFDETYVFTNVNAAVSSTTPEPLSALLLGMGLLGVGLSGVRRS